MKKLSQIQANQLIFTRNGAWVTIISIGKKIFGSIRFKAFIVFIVVSIIPLYLISAMLITSIKTQMIDDQKNEMSRKANTIATDLAVKGYFNEENDITSYLASINAMVAGRTLIVNAKGSVVYDSNFIETGKLYATEGILDALKGQSRYEYLEASNVIQVFAPVLHSESKTILGAVVITKSMQNITDDITALRRIATLLLSGLIILILTLSFYTSWLLTKPLKKLIQYVSGVSQGHIEEKLVIKGYTEIEEISMSFNHMIHRFLELEDNRQQFVANVSHELKTPLSSVKVLAESLLAREDVPKEVYREFLEDINNEVDREAKIINDLLTLVTLDKKENELNITKVNINELVESILKRLKPLAGKKNIQMIFESYRSIVAEVDETKLTLAISNLVENAIKYNKDFGLITTVLNADHKDFELIIKDTGIGIPEDSLEKIFERFYRIDKTRSRETGGTGLGLSIVQKTVVMHGGKIKCESVLEKGTKFIMRIPLKHITG